MKMTKRVWVFLLGASFLLGAGPSWGELQKVEAVGIYGIRDSMRSKVIPRDEAIAKARWEGVSRVALELIGESGTSAERVPEPRRGDRPPRDLESPPTSAQDASPEDHAATLRRALGEDVLPYMRGYRILDDRGEVPALFNDEKDVSVEYVVVVEVVVDVDRVVAALAASGLVEKTDQGGPAESVVVELIGLSRYEALEEVVEILKRDCGATRVRTVEFSRERQILMVEGPLTADALLTKLAKLDHSQLVLEPVGVDSRGRRIRLTGHWFAESDADSRRGS